MTEQFPCWRDMTPEATQDYIEKVAEELDAKFAELVKRGRSKPVPLTRREIRNP